MPELAEIVSATISVSHMMPSGIAQADQDRGQRPGQDDPPEQREAAEPVDPRHLDQAAVDRADAVEGVEVDREGAADRHEEDLRPLVDAEPQDDERDDRQVRHVAQHLHRGVEDGLRRPRDAAEDAEHEADAAADEEALERAFGRDRRVGQQRAVREALPERGEDGARRGQQPARDQPALRRDLPREEEDEGQRPGRERPERRRSAGAEPGRHGHAS